MFEIPIPKDWADHSIGELDIRKKFNINIMGIKKSGKLELSISSDTVLKAGDTPLCALNYKSKGVKKVKENAHLY